MSGQRTTVVEVSGISVSRGSMRVLHDVDLTIESGELVALLGANGSGKSTLLRAIVGVLPVETGTARLFGSPVQQARAHDRMGYVPQDSAEAGSIPATARETVAAGLLGSRSWWPRTRDSRVIDALRAVGLEDLAGRPITRMSGGQRRRVMIARALVRDPEFLVLDEPFSGVDLPTQQLISVLFRELSARGTTILVVLHETGLLEGDIHRAVVLDHGHVVHDGPAKDRPHLDPGHGHPEDAAPLDECLGQEIHPA
ncbi:metal ABC transporter ATP-binding protein [Brachybacterium alimentarium]|uniref:metal ABC transporter ATP-binding protein n=1 Tax=Brachybacterium alimentarium TaxID=47845 RepID=UPI000DF48492|nr:metal ABC transporter ATP-binding protein [Brachybacterium alimentarium]RCS88817.1 metal ABC transporter ATP-binding protein [Brachybacterium alimentarium]